MPDVVGKAVFQVETDTSGVQRGLDAVEGKAKATGRAVEGAFGAKTKAATTGLNAQLTGIGQRLERINKSGGLAKGILGGVGLGGGLLAFQAVKGALEGVVHSYEDVLHAAEAEQAASAKLNTSLAANVKGWDGETTAIDDNITAREKLGFTAVDQKNALALLLVQTHDQTKALDAERVAMDLARLKGIDLSSASVLVGKAYNGNITSLKRLGIELPKGTRGMAALAAITKVASGQAEAFRNTQEGAAQALHAELESAMAKVGQALLPVAAGLTDLAAQTIPVVIAAVTDLAHAWGNLMDLLDPTSAELRNVDTMLREQAKGLGISGDALVAFRKDQAAGTQATKDGLLSQKLMNAQIADFAQQLSDAGVTGQDYIDQLATYKAAVMGSSDATAKATADETELEKVRRMSADTLRAYMDDQREANDLAGQAALYNGRNKKSVDDLVPSLDDAGNAVVMWIKKVAQTKPILQSMGPDMTQLAGIITASFVDVPKKLQKTLGKTKLVIHHELTDARKEAQLGMAEIVYALKHPMDQAHLERFYAKKIADAEKKRRQAIREGASAALHLADQEIAKWNARLANLKNMDATLVLTVMAGNRGAGAGLKWYQQQQANRSNAQSQDNFNRGQATGGYRPAGWSGMWGENGPERVRLLSNGGAVTSASQGSNAMPSTITIRHEISLSGAQNLRAAGYDERGVAAFMIATPDQAISRWRSQR